MYSIYNLTDPRSGRIYYVGCTTWPEQRLRQHICASDECSANTINLELRQAGLQPVMNILATTDDRSEASELERQWIASYDTLVNKNPGGLPEGRELTLEEMRAELAALELESYARTT